MSDPLLPPSPPESLLDWALRYIRLGWPVFPLGARSKLPLIKGGNGCLDATLSEDQAREWWTRWPKANIGIATGHRFFVFDVDPLKGGSDALESLVHQHGPLPDTAQQVTGRAGTHYLFQLATDFAVPNTESFLGQGLDTRGYHGYILGAPSIHPDTGKPYFWDGATEIEEQRIAAAPAWMIERLRQHGKRAAGPEPVPAKIPKGHQHKTLVSIAGGMRKRGLDADAIYAALKVVNETRCTEPGPDRNIRRIADSVARYAPDARFDLFQAVPEEAGGDACDAVELPLGEADVEAAVDAVQTLAEVMRLRPQIARLSVQAQTLIKAKLRVRFKGQFSARDFDAGIKELMAQAEAQAPEDDDDDDESVPDLTGYPLTDSGNGERMAAMFGKDMRFCVEFDKWLRWDSRRWQIDDAEEVTQWAKQMARALHRQARRKSGMKEALQAHARASESHAAISAMLKRAATEPGIPIRATELDQHSYLLNCRNGVVDLRTGERVKHDRGYLITKLCPIDYKPDAALPKMFLAFVWWAMGASWEAAHNEDAELPESTVRLVEFLQKAFGYAMTADVGEKAAFIFYGRTGHNGKTTLLTIVTSLLDDYSTKLDINTLMQGKATDNNVRADLARLHGVRLAMTTELDDSQRLSERLFKELAAGMGDITACRKFENPFQFKATHKMFVDGNHRPVIRGTDDAIWQRLRCVPFNSHLDDGDPRMDRKLKDKILSQEPEGVLAWLVRGAVRWAKEGLGMPLDVKESTEAWRRSDDPLREFLDECCELGPADEGYWIQRKHLSSSYRAWCKENGENFPLSRKHFTERLESKGIVESRSRRDGANKQMRTWEGIRLNPDVTLPLTRGRDGDEG